MTEILQGSIVLKDRCTYGQLVLADGLIAEIILDESKFHEPSLLVEDGHFISPGFIDLQINGGFGKEFKSDDDAIGVVSNGLPRFGTTSFCPTVTTKNIREYPEHLASLASNAQRAEGAKWLGFHLEGPFLNPDKVGAQSADLLEEPIHCDYNGYVNKDVKIVTFSPELEGSLPFLKQLISDGLKVGVGHSVISYDGLVALFDPENMMIVHVYNAMSDLNSRKPGVLGAALDRDDYYCSLIADGIHVSAPSVRIFWKSKLDKSRVFLITDGSAVAGMDIGIHQIGTRSIEKRSDRAVLEGTETLVGSILTLNTAIRNLVEITGCTLAQAVNCASRNPAIFLGIADKTGSLEVGLSADVAVLNERYDVIKTFVDGRTVYSAP